MDLAVSIVKHLFAEQGNVGRLEDFVVICQLKRTQLRAEPVQVEGDQFNSTYFRSFGHNFYQLWLHCTKVIAES